jgi:hypothetical protein
MGKTTYHSFLFLLLRFMLHFGSLSSFLCFYYRYCTGGIRCEMASAYIRSKGSGFENVFQVSSYREFPPKQFCYYYVDFFENCFWTWEVQILQTIHIRWVSDIDTAEFFTLLISLSLSLSQTNSFLVLLFWHVLCLLAFAIYLCRYVLTCRMVSNIFKNWHIAISISILYRMLIPSWYWCFLVLKHRL